MQPKPVEIQTRLHDGGAPGTISTAVGAELSHLVLEPQPSPLATIPPSDAPRQRATRKSPQEAAQAISHPQAKRDRNEYQREFMRKKRAKEKAEKMANAAKG